MKSLSLIRVLGISQTWSWTEVICSFHIITRTELTMLCIHLLQVRGDFNCLEPCPIFTTLSPWLPDCPWAAEASQMCERILLTWQRNTVKLCPHGSWPHAATTMLPRPCACYTLRRRTHRRRPREASRHAGPGPAPRLTRSVFLHFCRLLRAEYTQLTPTSHLKIPN